MSKMEGVSTEQLLEAISFTAIYFRATENKHNGAEICVYSAWHLECLTVEHA